MKKIAVCLLALFGLLSLSPAIAQDYPSRPISLVVGFAPGGNIDVTARTVATAMAKVLGQPVVVENRPGAGGIVAHTAVANAEPNGYTIALVATSGFVLAPRLVAKHPYTLQNFSAIGGVSLVPMVLEVAKDSKFKTFQEFVSFAKANPESVKIGHAGNGTSNHLAILRLQEVLGIKFTIVPYKGSAPALTDLLGGSTDAVVDQMPSSVGHLGSGALRALAVTSLTRAPDLPNIQTLDELGLKGFEAVTESGLVVPAKTPPAVIAKLSDALSKALNDPDLIKQFKTLGAQPRRMTASEHLAALQAEDKRSEEMIKQGIFAVE